MGSVDTEAALALIAEAEDLPHGPARMAVSEEAVRLADAAGDPVVAYAARMSVLESAVFGGYPEKALVAFGWLVAICDRDPERFPASKALGGFLVLEVDLLWAYKWVVQNTPGFPQISRAQIEDTLVQMATQFSRHGFSMRPVWMSRIWVGMELGAPVEEIAEYFSEWTTSPRDGYADCEACEQSFRVDVQRYLGHWDGEVAAAQPLLAGEMACAEVPHITISNLVMPMWLHGELDEAARLHQRGYQMCRDNRDFLAELAEHIDYRIVTDDLPGALSMAERHLPWVDETRVGRRQWRWFVTLGELFDRVAGSHETLEFRLPSRLAPDQEADRSRPAALATFFRGKADALSEAFDARNGNDSVSAHAETLRNRLRVARA